MFFNEHDMEHNFLTPRTCQKNDVERKIRILQEMARNMLNKNY